MQDFYLYRQAWRFDGAPHEEQKLQKKEWKALLKQGGLMVRNTYDFDCQETCFWNLIKDQFGGLEELSGNTRKKVRRSLEHLEFRRIDNEPILKLGYPILRATFDDYAVTDRLTNRQTFEAYMKWCEMNGHQTGIQKEKHCLSILWIILFHEQVLFTRKRLSLCHRWLT